MTKIWKGKRWLLLALALLMIITALPNSALANSITYTEDYSSHKGGTAKFNPEMSYGTAYLAASPADGISYAPGYSISFAGYMETVFVIEDVYAANGGLWYKLKAAEGSTLPEAMVSKPWVFQNDLPNTGALDTLIITPPEEEPPYDGPSISNTVIDAQGNEQTVTVWGYDLPEGAELEVTIPEVNGEKLPNVFDIKVYAPNEQGVMTEWQPIDEGKTVNISIPVDDPEVKRADVWHFLDNKEAIHEDVEYWSIDGMEDGALDVFAPAIAASGKMGYVAVEKFEDISVIDGFVQFNTSSFSIYELNTKDEFEISDLPENITFDNISAQAPDDYYATPGTEFTLATRTDVRFNPYNPNGKYFNVEDGSEYVIIDDEIGERGDIVQVKIRIAADVPAGTKLTIRYHTKVPLLGVEGYNILATIIVVRPIEIKYDANLPEGVVASNIPDDRIKYSDEDDRRVYTDANEAKFTLLTDKIPTAVNSIDPADTFIFKGWSTTRLGDVNFYEWDGTKFSPENFTPTQDLTLYAIWERGKCEVTFDDNNGTEKKVSYTVTYGEEVTAPAKPSRDGYVFLGWCASLEGDATRYFPATDNKPADKIPIKSDVVMYALWGVKLDIITIGGSLSVQKDNEGKFTQIETNNDYGFEVKSAGNDVTTYYIVLPEYSYANAYFRFTPTTEGNTITIDHVGSDMEYLKIINSNKYSGDVRISEAGLTTETKITFTALDKYVVSFVTNGGSPLSSVAVDKGSGLNLGDYKTEQAGYGDVEWYLTPDFSGQPITKLENITQNITVYAKWTANSYTITYRDSNSETTASYTIKDILNLTRSKPGYTFMGWTVTAADGNWELNRTYTGAVTGMYGNVTLTAQWEINSHKVTYMVDGVKYGEVETYEYDADVSIKPVPAVKEGHTFSGWKIDGTAAADFTMPDHDVTIEGSWAINQYTITWVDGFGNEVYKVTQDYGSVVTAPATPVAPSEGYSFAGWNENPSTMPLNGATITAKWTTSVSASINNNGTISGTFNGQEVSATGSWGVDKVPLGLGAGATITFKPANNYRIINVTVTIDDKKVDSGSFTKDGYTYTVPEGGITGPLTIEVITAPDTTNLTIQVTGCDTTLDPNQTFLFTVVGTDGVELTVTVLGNTPVTIQGVTIGNKYTVTIDNDWSWRYESKPESIVATKDADAVKTANNSITVTLEEGEIVTFNMTRTNLWLDGNDYHQG